MIRTCCKRCSCLHFCCRRNSIYICISFCCIKISIWNVHQHIRFLRGWCFRGTLDCFQCCLFDGLWSTGSSGYRRPSVDSIFRSILSCQQCPDSVFLTVSFTEIAAVVSFHIAIFRCGCNIRDFSILYRYRDIHIILIPLIVCILDGSVNMSGSCIGSICCHFISSYCKCCCRAGTHHHSCCHDRSPYFCWNLFSFHKI